MYLNYARLRKQRLFANEGLTRRRWAIRRTSLVFNINILKVCWRVRANSDYTFRIVSHSLLNRVKIMKIGATYRRGWWNWRKPASVGFVNVNKTKARIREQIDGRRPPEIFARISSSSSIGGDHVGKCYSIMNELWRATMTVYERDSRQTEERSGGEDHV